MKLFNVLANTPVVEKNSKKLIIFFAGWGMDEKPFLHLTSQQYDVAIFYDYSSFGFTECVIPTFNYFKEYSQINIIAWSMGVWGACNTLNLFKSILEKACTPEDAQEILSKANQRIAINGTLFPIHSSWGIPQEIFDATIENLPAGLNKFNLRMCGSKSVLEKYTSPTRDGEEIKKELIAIKENYQLYNSIKWDKAIISSNDNIIPTKNQQSFWEDYNLSSQKEVEIIEIDGGHYPFYKWKTWDEIIEIKCTNL